MKVDEIIPQEYKSLKLYNWNGIYYYKNKPLEEVISLPGYLGEEIDKHNDYPGGVWKIYNSGYVIGETLGGTKYLKIKCNE